MADTEIKINEYYALADEMLKENCDKRFIIIGKYDESGNIVSFFNIEREGVTLCGGHIGLYNNETDIMEVPFSELISFLSYCQINNIAIKFERCYMLKEKLKSYLKEKQFTTVHMENEKYYEVLFYDEKKREKIIFLFLIDKTCKESVVEIGNLFVNDKVYAGLVSEIAYCENIEEKLNKEITSITDSILKDLSLDYADEQMRLQQIFVNHDEIIKRYAEDYNYSIVDNPE